MRVKRSGEDGSPALTFGRRLDGEMALLFGFGHFGGPGHGGNQLPGQSMAAQEGLGQQEEGAAD